MRLLFTFQYLGTRYAGWGVQPRQQTVQATLESALAETLGDAPTLALALYERGCLAMREGDDARAGTLLEQTVDIWRRLGHKQATAEALGASSREQP